MHDRRIVVWQVISSEFQLIKFYKVVAFTRADVLLVDGHVVIAVVTRVFVEQSDHVTDLMNDVTIAIL